MIKYDISGSGKVTITKDTDDRKLYGIEVGPVLTAQETTIASVIIADVEGVSITTQIGGEGDAFIKGTKCLAWITGGDPATANYATFRVTLADGTIFDQTLYFKIRRN